MNLIKAAAYALLGYVLYELIVGIAEGEPARAKTGANAGGRSIEGSGSGSGSGSRSSAKGRRDLHRALNENPGRLSGPGKGANEETHESGGGSSNRAVGRGVTR